MPLSEEGGHQSGPGATFAVRGGTGTLLWGPEWQQGGAHSTRMLLAMLSPNVGPWDLETCFIHPSVYLLIFKSFIYLFSERGEGREKDREKHQYVVASRAPPAGDLACNPGMCPDWELNR